MRGRWGRFALVAAAVWGLAAAASAQPTCSGVFLVDETLTSGARWRLCWEQHTNAGVVYSEIHYTPPGGSERLVLYDFRLAQIFVPYDDDGARFHDITDYGAGGANLRDLGPGDCPGGTLLRTQGKDCVCRTVRARGSAYHAAGHALQGNELSLFSVSAIGQYNYIPQLLFQDDGAIEVRMGATGALQRTSTQASNLPHGWPIDAGSLIGISHMHNYYYRLDFDIGGTANGDVFERIDAVADGSAATRTRTVTPFTVEGHDDVAPDALRSWRIRDDVITNAHGQPISYELVPLESGHRDVGPAGEPFTHHDIYVTKRKSNELYASHNNFNANEDITDFYDPPESLSGADLMVWYGLSFHHIPRDEDEARMHAHWNGFRLEPRNWNDAHPLAPPIVAVPAVSPSGLVVGIALLAAAAGAALRRRPSRASARS